jgi:L-iditol 2-dehydrogenase
MRAVYMPRPGELGVGEFDVPEPGPGQVLVRMQYAGICGSDVHAVYRGMHRPQALGTPGYPGHEGIGVVVESRSSATAEGANVLTVPVAATGGCFAEYQVVDENYLIPAPVEDDQIQLLMAQQLGTTICAMKRFWPYPDGTGKVAAIIGMGPAGLFFLQHLVRLGFEHVIVSDRLPRRLAVARRLGADASVEAAAGALSQYVLEASAGAGADLVIEAAGYDACRAEALECVRKGGRLAFFGYPEGLSGGSLPVNLAFRKAVTMEWFSGTQEEPGLKSFRQALIQIRDKSIRVDYCCTSMHSLDAVPRIISDAHKLQFNDVKAVISVS